MLHDNHYRFLLDFSLKNRQHTAAGRLVFAWSLRQIESLLHKILADEEVYRCKHRCDQKRRKEERHIEAHIVFHADLEVE
jgi:hypothetical protein